MLGSACIIALLASRPDGASGFPVHRGAFSTMQVHRELLPLSEVPEPTGRPLINGIFQSLVNPCYNAPGWLAEFLEDIANSHIFLNIVQRAAAFDLAPSVIREVHLEQFPDTERGHSSGRLADGDDAGEFQSWECKIELQMQGRSPMLPPTVSGHPAGPFVLIVTSTRPLTFNGVRQQATADPVVVELSPEIKQAP
ncbi:hypothetical protein HYPSUDRAFT_209119 [Hypholoma sublateritium FD-334 SS-4]|uniref:Uncharacterized protein n=1 Tax=Hypholoma sublateritium (strain FD-334 SS-4) TaxID=945553 RepID=A0A0D2LSW0_HYPSF|nr:hypothetical protein HYPSUDRAFT_209119 [Hypholoma sublateritium FD-334 SS-4]